jgi:predicted short-subunit dehydrogenase-like oxidoreductase (DUF2520 family)
MKTVAIIGAGRVGGAVGALLANAGYRVTAVATRSRETAERARAFIGAVDATIDPVRAAASADIVFITTPDGAIRPVCEAIAASRGFRRGSLAVHTSGAHTRDLLDAARSAGAYRAVVHPLQSVPSMDVGVKNLPGSYFRIEADPEAADMARELVRALGGTELAMPGWRPDRHSVALYHAGAVAVSNYLVALVDYGLRFYLTLGTDRQDALKAVLPLIKGTLNNIEKLDTRAALTGPLARGDADTIAEHLAAMRERAPELLGPYRELAKLTIAVVREKGSITEQAVDELLAILDAENGPLL